MEYELKLPEGIEVRKYLPPSAVYSQKGDILKVYFNDQPSYALRLSDQISLLVSLASHEIIGCKVSGVNELVTGGQ